MKKYFLLAFIFLLSFYQLPAQKATLHFTGLEEILDRHTEAMGGRDVWRKLHTWVVHQQRPDGTVTIYARKPDRMKIEFKLADLHLVKSYDGQNGWILRNGTFEPMRPGEAIELAEEPQFYGELIYARDKGLPMELTGMEDLNGRPHYVLKLPKSPTDEQRYWIDAKTFLISQTAEYSEDPTHEGILYKTTFDDYRSVEGRMFPFQEALIANDEAPYSWEITKVEVNVPLSDPFFQYGAAPAGEFIALRQQLQQVLDSIVITEERPGATLAVILPDGRLISLASGFSDLEAQRPMKSGAQMFTGSTGKTFVSAVVLQLVAEGKFSLDDKVSKFFGDEPWFQYLPNAADLTVRSLMNHTSGLPRYIFQDAFLNELKANPMRTWTPRECLAIVLGMDPIHPVGKGWGYSDTNYILLGLIMEKVIGKSFYKMAQDRILAPYELRHTYPSTQRELPGLTPGYIGENNFFDMPEKTVENGLYAINPQFEWTGGGFVTNAEDMAWYHKWLHDGKILPAAQYAELTNVVDMKSGEPASQGYGLGTFIWQTDHGLFYGHAGIMPGHLTQVEYSKDHRFAVALQVNTDAGLGRTHHGHVQKIAEIIIEWLNG